MKQDNEEINKWIESYSGLLLNRALSMVTDKNDAMDLVQEVFISASLSYHAFQRKSTPLTWLQNILKNKIADFYRDRYRKPETVSIPDFFDSSGSWTDDSVLHEWPRISNEPEGENTILDVLDKCIERLPSQWQITVKRYYIDQKKADEVCHELDIAATNLWKILQRSRMQLRKCIESNWFDKL
ncbi:sigma-70 family RNA polymerase sigma factor [Bacteroides heparinolyticus]|uniref:sigma-70 family RNA polymerase sigma factor n=2 Tax=Prevotella heparinolytica TaxID=28113 RepID=UPI00359FB67F